MKAMVLAAGASTRLRPLTDHVPKPMVEIAGKPILDYTVAFLARHGVRDIVVNLHHCGDVIRGHLGDGRRWGVQIRYSPETELRGTAGALRPWRGFFDATFLLVYGDNMTTCDLTRLARVHADAGALATVALYWRDDPTRSGIAETAEDGRIVRFAEKPAPDQVFSRWINAGVLVLEPEAIDLIPDDRPSDFGRDLLPRWVAEGRPVYGHRMSAVERLWWIDTPADLAHVRAEFGEGVRP